MPIKPENKKLYPKNWKQISEYIRFVRAENRCENCGAINHSWLHQHTRKHCLPEEDFAVKIVLTVAHLDHDPTNNDHSNLMALCQKCHNSYDATHRANTRANSKFKNGNQISMDI